MYRLTTDGEVAPMLATAMPTVSDDGLTVTIPVRTDAVFSDGTPLDAEAVAVSLRRQIEDPQSARASEMGPIRSVETVDESTVRVSYERPFAPLLSALVAGGGVVYSPTALEEYGNDDIGNHITCVGPFTVEERVPQTSITLKRNPDYYAADDIHLDSIVFRVMPDSSVRATNLRAGDVQATDVVSSQDVDSMMADDAVVVLNQSSLGYNHVNFNLANQGPNAESKPIDGPSADPVVRQAFSMAVDRENLVSSVFDGWFESNCSPIPPASGLTSDLSDACPEYDPEGARALLEENGVKTPVSIDLKVINSPDNLRFSQALQAMVAEAGFEIDVQPLDVSTFMADAINGNYEAILSSWSGRLDPNGNMYNFLAESGGLNWNGYANPAVTDLLDRAQAALDVDERIDLYGQAMELVHEDNPAVYLYRIRNLAGLSVDLAGVDLLIDGIVDVSRAARVE
ncbi:ABC transporter substrate-binding protein [Nocardioides houyundeii]|uniref:ABC transporter substrate-binding protein n=1 Tax=Nocardioides houyundeii TaxID=2045452 RepID=UPI00196350F1|nr:ABC transporter substrate-binding protein [Nocardioides houyundeii]